MQSKAKYNLALFNPKSKNFGWGREMCENHNQIFCVVILIIVIGDLPRQAWVLNSHLIMIMTGDQTSKRSEKQYKNEEKMCGRATLGADSLVKSSD